jgi:hypothetical protein
MTQRFDVGKTAAGKLADVRPAERILAEKNGSSSMNSVDRARENAQFAVRLADLRDSIARSKILREESAALIGRARTALQDYDGRPSTEAAFAIFSGYLRTRGIREALAYVLRLSQFRFIGLFRFEGGRANAVVHVDRENPDVLTVREVPDSVTYCCYVRDSRGAFTTAHAMLDPRLDNHAAREAVPAYCGIPVMDAEGTLLGTLCHYDFVPRNPEALDLPLLLQVASALAQSGLVPAYPR